MFAVGTFFVILMSHAFSAKNVDYSPECLTAECAPKIPQIIHQTYLHDRVEEFPETCRTTPKMWQDQHSGWEYILWTDVMNRELIATHYPWFLDTYDAYPNGIQRSDAARYFILYHHGGVYADLDIQPLKSVVEMFGDYDVYLPYTPNIGLTNAFMASVKGADFFEMVIHNLADYQNAWYHVSRHWQIVTSTGPTFIWTLWMNYEGSSTVATIDAPVWAKCSICTTNCHTLSGGFFQHVKGDSWHRWDSTAFTYVFFCHPVPLATAVFIGVLFYKKGKKGAQVWMLQNYLMMYGLVSCCAIAMERSLRM